MITSLNHIPEELDDDRYHQSFTETSYTVTEKTIGIDNNQPKQTAINQIQEINKNYLKRGSLNTDRLLLLIRSVNSFKQNEKDSLKITDTDNYKLNDRDKLLMDILKQDVIDLQFEENQNIAIYILRKKIKNELEVNFLNNLVKNLPFFSSSNVQQETKDNSQFKRIVQVLQYRHFNKQQTIFNYGEKGTEFFTVIKGAAFCLVPDPTYKKFEQIKKHQQLKQIEKKDNESKVEATARDFLNNIVQGVNKKIKIEHNVLSFVDIIRSQARLKKQKKPAGRQLMRSTTKQLEEMFEEEEKQNDVLSDTEFLKQQFPGFILVKTFLPGDSFGEIALMTQQNRSATLVAKEDCDLLVLDKEGFDKTISYMKQNTIREKIEFIKSFEFFSTLSTKRVLQLIQQFKVIKVNGRQNIYEEGDNSNFFFLIKEGEVELQSRYSNPQELVKQYSIDNDKEYDDTKDIKDLRMKKAKINVNKLHTVKILGQNSYFGEEEIVKSLSKREAKAICKGQGAEIYAIEKRRLHQVLGYNIFDRFKQSVDFKEELKSERLKNAIKMQIPQKDISNLNEFLEKDKKKKELEIQKEELKKVLLKKQKLSFSKRFQDQNDKEKLVDNNKNRGSTEKFEDESEEISDSDIQEYNRVKNLEQQKKVFYKIHDKLNQMHKNNQEMTVNHANPNVIQPIFPQKDNRKSFRNTQVQTLDDLKMSTELKQIPKQTTPKIDIRRASNKIITTLDNSLDEYIQKSARTIQIKSFTNLFEIDDKPVEKEEYQLQEPSNKQSKGPSQTNILLNDQGSSDDNTKEKVIQLQVKPMTKTDKLILNLSKNSLVQKQLKQIKEQNEALQKSKTPQRTYQIYNFQKTLTPSQNNQEESSPQKMRVQNSSNKILKIAGTGLFHEEIGNSHSVSNFTSPKSRPLITISSSSNTIAHRQVKTSQAKNRFHIRSSSKSQVTLNNPSEFSASQIQLNNSHTCVTPSQNVFSQSSTSTNNNYKNQLGAFSIPSFTTLSSIQNFSSIQTTKQNSQQANNKEYATEIKNDIIIEEIPISEFNLEKQIKNNSQQRKSQISSSKDAQQARRSLLLSPQAASISSAFDEQKYAKKPLSSRIVKKEIVPHKMRPITKLENNSYFNSVLHLSNQGSPFKNLNISQQNVKQVRSNSQIKGITQQGTKTLYNFYKTPDVKEESKTIGLEQFRKRVSTINKNTVAQQTQLNGNHLVSQETNSSSMSMLRIRRSQLATNTDEIFSKTTRNTSSHQLFNRNFNQSQQQQQATQNISLAILSSKYSDNKNILF
ncbi:hypothetical protein ABPG72_001573 [Tetrahymena utriculariae]